MELLFYIFPKSRKEAIHHVLRGVFIRESGRRLHRDRHVRGWIRLDPTERPRAHRGRPRGVGPRRRRSSVRRPHGGRARASVVRRPRRAGRRARRRRRRRRQRRTRSIRLYSSSPARHRGLNDDDDDTPTCIHFVIHHIHQNQSRPGDTHIARARHLTPPCAPFRVVPITHRIRARLPARLTRRTKPPTRAHGRHHPSSSYQGSEIRAMITSTSSPRSPGVDIRRPSSTSIESIGFETSRARERGRTGKEV